MAQIGSEIHRFKKVTSTNDVLKGMALNGSAEGTVVIAREQSRGKGRQGKTWLSPLDKGLYLSVLLKPRLDTRYTGLFSLFAAAAVSTAISKTAGVAAGVKWPNDVLIRSKKVAGILVESSSATLIKFMVIGVGINVTGDFFPKSGLAATAGSLAGLSGRAVDRADLLDAVLGEMNALYALMEDVKKWRRRVVDLWCGLCAHLGQEVRMISDEGVFDGLFTGVTETGEAILKIGAQNRFFSAGLCSMRKDHATRN
jgi:BirA family biotin operon repressor/biotin-[acetyl-CoA-carboxylase] ligase